MRSVGRCFVFCSECIGGSACESTSDCPNSTRLLVFFVFFSGCCVRFLPIYHTRITLVSQADMSAVSTTHIPLQCKAIAIMSGAIETEKMVALDKSFQDSGRRLKAVLESMLSNQTCTREQLSKLMWEIAFFQMQCEEARLACSDSENKTAETCKPPSCGPRMT